jgi:hypothetical protein
LEGIAEEFWETLHRLPLGTGATLRVVNVLLLNCVVHLAATT